MVVVGSSFINGPTWTRFVGVWGLSVSIKLKKAHMLSLKSTKTWKLWTLRLVQWPFTIYSLSHWSSDTNTRNSKYSSASSKFHSSSSDNSFDNLQTWTSAMKSHVWQQTFLVNLQRPLTFLFFFFWNTTSHWLGGLVGSSEGITNYQSFRYKKCIFCQPISYYISLTGNLRDTNIIKVWGKRHDIRNHSI